MDAEEFRKYGRKMVDYIADYLENIRERDVVHKVTPGYLKKLLPSEAPENPEDFEEVFKDIEKFIMPGVSFHERTQTLIFANIRPLGNYLG